MGHPFAVKLLSYIFPPGGEPAVAGAVVMVDILRELAACEIEEGGPYAVTRDGSLKDVDPGFNLIVAVFLSLHDVHLPKLDAFLEATLSSQYALFSQTLDSDILDRLVRMYRKGHGEDNSDPTPPPFEATAEHEMLDAIYAQAHQRFALLPDPFVQDAMRVIDRTVEGNPDKQMSLMAYYVRRSLGNRGGMFTDTDVAVLGLANVFFWTAFIVYDDFWDEDEAAEPRLLPVANLFARYHTDFFLTLLPSETGFRDFFHMTMDTLDSANQWEMLHCRMKCEGGVVTVPDELPSYGEYDVKFYPASGHILGPVAMLVRLGYAIDGPEIANTISYFRHYLIAMQLNDDMHDWKEDLARGNLSCAVTPLLAAWKKHHPDRLLINLVEDMADLEQIFWFDVLGPLCHAVLRRTEEAHSALHATTIFEDYSFLEAFIERNTRMAHKALSEQRTSVAFLNALSI